MTMMRLSPFLILMLLLAATTLAGCSSLGHVDELWLLKQYGDETEEMDKDVDLAEDRFRAIVAAAQNGELARGLDRGAVRERFGDPVYVQQPADAHDADELWMYRRPVHFFESDQVLLYFNKEGYLESHTLKRHQPASGE